MRKILLSLFLLFTLGLSASERQELIKEYNNAYQTFSYISQLAEDLPPSITPSYNSHLIPNPVTIELLRRASNIIAPIEPIESYDLIELKELLTRINNNNNSQLPYLQFYSEISDIGIDNYLQTVSNDPEFTSNLRNLYFKGSNDLIELLRNNTNKIDNSLKISEKDEIQISFAPYPLILWLLIFLLFTLPITFLLFIINKKLVYLSKLYSKYHSKYLIITTKLENAFNSRTMHSELDNIKNFNENTYNLVIEINDLFDQSSILSTKISTSFNIMVKFSRISFFKKLIYVFIYPIFHIRYSKLTNHFLETDSEDYLTIDQALSNLEKLIKDSRDLLNVYVFHKNHCIKKSQELYELLIKFPSHSDSREPLFSIPINFDAKLEKLNSNSYCYIDNKPYYDNYVEECKVIQELHNSISELKSQYNSLLSKHFAIIKNLSWFNYKYNDHVYNLQSSIRSSQWKQSIELSNQFLFWLQRIEKYIVNYDSKISHYIQKLTEVEEKVNANTSLSVINPNIETVKHVINTIPYLMPLGNSILLEHLFAQLEQSFNEIDSKINDILNYSSLYNNYEELLSQLDNSTKIYTELSEKYNSELIDSFIDNNNLALLSKKVDTNKNKLIQTVQIKLHSEFIKEYVEQINELEFKIELFSKTVDTIYSYISDKIKHLNSYSKADNELISKALHLYESLPTTVEYSLTFFKKYIHLADIISTIRNQHKQAILIHKLINLLKTCFSELDNYMEDSIQKEINRHTLSSLLKEKDGFEKYSKLLSLYVTTLKSVHDLVSPEDIETFLSIMQTFNNTLSIDPCFTITIFDYNISQQEIYQLIKNIYKEEISYTFKNSIQIKIKYALSLFELEKYRQQYLMNKYLIPL